jgi:serine/threonine-protein kinase
MPIHDLNKDFLATFKITGFFKEGKRGGQKAVHFVEAEGTKYAMKLLLASGIDERTKRELDIYNKFKGLDGIPTIYKIESYEGELVVFEEFVEGNCLGDIIGEFKGDSDRINALIKALCKIMKPIWDGNYIHRDIKPQNLKLTDENHIVLLDFGLSKDTANQSVVSAPGTSGSVVGYTPHFAPMEQIRGTGTNPRSDIYSLSATLYQLMTNVVPADALSRADVMLNSQADPIQPLSALNPEITPAVSDVILKGLEVSQEKRFASAGEMQKALRAAYAQIQTAMSADTVVITADDISSDVHLTSPPLNTNAPVAPSEMATITNSQPFVSPVVTSPEIIEPVSEAPALEATIQMDRADAIEEIRQADVKTEVFLGADSPVAAAVPPSPFADADDRPAETSPEPTPSFEPAATVPLIDVSEVNTAPEPPTPEFFEPPAEVSAPPPEPAVSANVPPMPATAAKAAAPKMRSKAGLVIGGLVGLLLLGAIAAGAAWFIYTNFMGPANVSPSPTPSPVASATPAATASPTPEPSPTATPESNTNSGSNSGITVSPTPEPTTASTPSARPTPQTGPVKTPPVGPAKTPVTKPPVTPKAKPNNDRTVIDQ